MLLDNEIGKVENLLLKSEPGPPYSELNTGNWWATAEKKSGASLNSEYCIMPIILYTDGASPDFRRSVSLKPIVVQCGNYVGAVNRTSNGKRCAGFWPKIKVICGVDLGFASYLYVQINKLTAFAKKKKREFYQWIVECLTMNIEEYRDGLLLRVNGKDVWFVPVLAFFVTDWPEGQAMSLTKAGATQSRMNCRVCERPTAEFGITWDGGLGSMREMKKTKAKVKAFSRSNVTAAAVHKVEVTSCLYMERCGVWRGELYSDRYGHHAMFPYDFLHTVCHGTAVLLLDTLLAYAKKYHTMDGGCWVCGEGGGGCIRISGTPLPVLDDRLKRWPPVRDPMQRMMHTRQFNSGLSGISVHTADDMVALLQQFPFVVGAGCAVIKHPVCAAAFVSAAVVTRNILSVLKLREVGTGDLQFLEREILKMGELFRDMQSDLPDKDRVLFAVPKFHSVCHFPFFIRRFGCALNFDSGTHERFHRDIVVAPFKMDARREVGQLNRLYEMNNERALLSSYFRSLSVRSIVPAQQQQANVRHIFETPVAEIKHCLASCSGGVEKAIKSVFVTTFGLMQATALFDGGAGLVYSKFIIDFGEEKVLFVNSECYLGKGRRSDCVEVALATEPPSPAEVVWFFEDLVKAKKVLVKWFKPMQPFVQPQLSAKMFMASAPTVPSNYTICDVDSITGHAHMVPNYDNPTIVYWDVINF